MNPSTQDEIQGTVHEVKGKIKETAGKVTNSSNLEAEALLKKTPAKLRKRSGRSKKCSRSKFNGVSLALGVLYWRPRFSASRGDRSMHESTPPSLWTIIARSIVRLLYEIPSL